MTESITILKSVRNERFLIWNFMHELLDNYEKAIRTCSSTVFNINDFKSLRLPIFHHNRAFVLETLNQYQRSRDFIRIQDDTVTLTSKGIMRYREGKDWD